MLVTSSMPAVTVMMVVIVTAMVATAADSRTAPYLAAALGQETGRQHQRKPRFDNTQAMS